MKNLRWITMLAAAAFACGDDDNNNDGGTDVTPDAPEPAIDASVVIDAPIDAPVAPFVVPAPFQIRVAMAGPDQAQSVVATPDDKFLVAGFLAATPAGAKTLFVAKITTTGPDTTFGEAGNFGVVQIPAVTVIGGNDEIDIALQSTGHIIVTATIADEVVATDRDIAIVRLTPTGALDTAFGTNGVIRLDWSTGLANGTGGTTAADASRSVAVGPADAIFVHGAKRAPGLTATDTDFAIAKYSATGTLDAAYGESGIFTFGFNYLDEAGVPAPVTARGINVLPDGSAIGAGYTTTQSGTGQPIAPLLYRVTPAGDLDANFAEGGLYYELLLARMTEIYSVAVHGDNLVTAGYGRESGDDNEYISLRFNAATGVRDTTWGGAVNGAVVFDVSDADVTNNARNAVALPNGKTLIVGSAGTGNPGQNAAFAILDATGAKDTLYGDGTHTLPLGADAVDQFWGAAASATHIMIVGYAGYGATQTEAANDNSFGLVFPIR